MPKSTTRKRTDGRPLQQFAALAYVRRPGGTVEVLVMSSRETRRAVIPKGWPMKNRKSWKTAQIEARQEAGVIGEVGRRRLGQYRYWKRMEQNFALVKVSVYPLRVTRQLTEWPEKHERALFWLSPEDAAILVDEPELGDLIRDFAGALLSPGKVRKLSVKKRAVKKAATRKAAPKDEAPRPDGADAEQVLAPETQARPAENSAPKAGKSKAGKRKAASTDKREAKSRAEKASQPTAKGSSKNPVTDASERSKAPSRRGSRTPAAA